MLSVRWSCCGPCSRLVATLCSSPDRSAVSALHCPRGSCSSLPRSLEANLPPCLTEKTEAITHNQLPLILANKCISAPLTIFLCISKQEVRLLPAEVTFPKTASAASIFFYISTSFLVCLFPGGANRHRSFPTEKHSPSTTQVPPATPLSYKSALYFLLATFTQSLSS